jgi:assimilatory nitrate reductase catalytic subunit
MTFNSSAQAPTRTTCPYCGVGCGIVARAATDGSVEISGDKEHPANFGRLCSKGAALGETVSLEGRLLHPMVRRSNGHYEKVSWDLALDTMAEGIERNRRAHGPDALSFYLSGQLLTEDYYVANKLMKGFLGSSNVDTNSRLCMASSVAGHKRAFGGDVVPGCYEDLDRADVIVLVGSNTAWCHPVLFQRIQANRAARGARTVVIDPRRTASADEADLFLPIAPGMDSILFSFLLTEIDRRGCIDRDYVASHTEGFDAALEAARSLAPDLETAARRCQLDAQLIEEFCDLWIKTSKVVSAWSQGVNQSAQGTDKVVSIINCHLATGRIGKEGCGPLSLTGQPNAMGGREVGGLANMLAAHMSFGAEEVDRVGRFWRAPLMARQEGLKAVQMFDAVAERRITAMWVMATNPAVSLPRADHVRVALAKLDFFAISEVVRSTDTLESGAHVLLPAAAWGEKDGTVTNSERRISRQRAFLPLPEEVRPDWWIVCEVAKRLGFGEFFEYAGPADIFREHAALSGFENDGARGFDIGGLAALDDRGYANLGPVQWPQPERGAPRTRRLFAEGKFVTPSGRARFCAPVMPALSVATSDAFPLLLNTGRIRDQWHTMTRTGLSPRLSAHIEEPFISLNEQDGECLALQDSGFCEVRSAFGRAVLRVRLDGTVAPGKVFAPMHWSHAMSSHGRVGSLVNPAVDLFSGQPELKATPVRVAPVSYQFEGAMVTRADVAMPEDAWWAKLALPGGIGYRLATEVSLASCGEWFAAAFAGYDVAEVVDEERGVYRATAFREGRFEAGLFIARERDEANWERLKAMLSVPSFTPAERLLAVSGRGIGQTSSCGPTVCACFGVSAGAIRDAIDAGARDAQAIGAQLKAGTNCGSCVPELKKMLAAGAELESVD